MKIEEKIDAHLCGMGIAINSVLTEDDFDGRSGASKWQVEINREGRVIRTPYSLGAHYRHYRNGRPIKLPVYCEEYTVNQYKRNKRTLPNKPCLVGVLGSLLCDTSDIDQPFGDWAKSLGFDTDSRKAERIFVACRETFFSLRSMFSEKELEDLRELYQDW